MYINYTNVYKFNVYYNNVYESSSSSLVYSLSLYISLFLSLFLSLSLTLSGPSVYRSRHVFQNTSNVSWSDDSIKEKLILC